MRVMVERAILALGVVLIAFTVRWLRPGRPGLGLLELTILVVGLGAFVLFIARVVDGRSWATRAEQIGKALAALASLFWAFALAELVGEIRMGIPGAFYYVFAVGNALALAGAVLAMRWTLAGAIVILAGAMAGTASGLFQPDPPMLDPASWTAVSFETARIFGAAVFAMPAFLVGTLLVASALGRSAERERPLGVWLRAIAGI